MICLKIRPLVEAFTMADSILKYTIEGITGIIFGKGTVNLDFNDLKSTITNTGLGHLGIGTVKKDDSIMDAVKQAINSPLLETDISTASKILINTSGRINLKELNEAVSYLKEITRPDVKILWGTVSYQNAEDDIVVTVIATGLNEKKQGNDPEVEYNGLDIFFQYDRKEQEVLYPANGKGNKKTELQIPVFLVKNAKMKQNIGKR